MNNGEFQDTSSAGAPATGEPVVQSGGASSPGGSPTTKANGAGRGRSRRSRRGGGGRTPGSSTGGRTVRRAMSAGGVVYRERNGHVEVVLVGRPRQGLWALPKGTPEPDETVEQTALREVAEETGLQVCIEREIGSIRYRYAVPSENLLVLKVVHHFLMTPVGGDLTLHDHEYDVVDWVDIHEAALRLSYGNERNIVEKASALIEQRRGRTGRRPASGASPLRGEGPGAAR